MDDEFVRARGAKDRLGKNRCSFFRSGPVGEVHEALSAETGDGVWANCALPFAQSPRAQISHRIRLNVAAHCPLIGITACISYGFTVQFVLLVAFLSMLCLVITLVRDR